MNDITHYATESVAGGHTTTNTLTRELERLWLLSALKVGLDQLGRGETNLADKAFLDGLETQLFVKGNEPVIDA